MTSPAVPSSHLPNHAWAAGLATTTNEGEVLDAWFPSPKLGTLPDEEVRESAIAELAEHAYTDTRRGVRQAALVVDSKLDEPITSVADAYLRLHLLSHLLVRPNQISLEGIFNHLPTNAWTSVGPTTPEFASKHRPALLRAGIQVYAVDKFPRMLDYVVPDRVRIADGGRVRLGAHLAPGTVVMHEGFVNFNAGTFGASMVEGRISQGVVVGDGSDIGGGASIMGTLSGGGKERITIGERALLGANAGVGISLGDDSIVEAGLYVTAGSKVYVVGAANGDGELGERRTVKASELSGIPNLLFRRNSVTGGIEAVHREGQGITLNADLHD